MDRKERRLLGLQQGTQWDRKFLGKMKEFESDEEKKFEKKHLKAYLKGFEKFTYGYVHQRNPITGLMETVPAWHEVQQELIKL